MDGNGRRDEKSCCYFHPKQLVIGVCHLCLNERLQIVAAKQGHRHNHRSFTCNASQRLQSSMHMKPSASIHKIFAFGSLFSRPESHQLKSDNYDDDSSSSLEDSFISIKFEENGVASWEKNPASNKVPDPLENNNNIMSQKNHHKKDGKESKRVILQHGKTTNNAFRWRKRIGHLFHLIQWRRSTKGSVCHVGNKVEGVKVRKGWMRTLAKRKTVE